MEATDTPEGVGSSPQVRGPRPPVFKRDSNPGSSPQVRGPRNQPRQRRLPTGLIPAGAGTTLTGTDVDELQGAHPRRCGDHYGTSGVPYCAMGSSPQVRGPPTAC